MDHRPFIANIRMLYGGLLDALQKVAPKAEVRFCVRHIWANFKLNFSGQLFKDSFWRAARATTKKQFDKEMDELKFLSTEAWAYLSAIPPNHWSRHAFSSHSKSNLLLNNLCESFNSVLKDARDKPILTLMEWIRRYVMRRSCEKREGVEKLEGKLMPYVNKYMQWAGNEARFCKPERSKVDEYEVDHNNRTWVVKLNEKTCDCYQWELSGLPCCHAVACMLVQRQDPKDFVDEAYTKEKYLLAYTPAIAPMPGVDQWENSGLPEPLPPLMRKMPGRPSSKKRKKETGEGQTSRVKRQKKQNKCSKCGQLGHYKRTCKNPTAHQTQERQPGGRPPAQNEWAKLAREKKEKRRAQKEVYARQQGTSVQHLLVPTSSSATYQPMSSPSFTELLTQASSSVAMWNTS